MIFQRTHKSSIHADPDWKFECWLLPFRGSIYKSNIISSRADCDHVISNCRVPLEAWTHFEHVSHAFRPSRRLEAPRSWSEAGRKARATIPASSCAPTEAERRSTHSVEDYFVQAAGPALSV